MPERPYVGETLTHACQRTIYGLRMDPSFDSAPVFCIDGRRLGVVESSRSCCFTVRTMEGRRLALTHAAVMSGNASRVSLVCGRTGVVRYACPIHDAAAVTAAV